MAQSGPFEAFLFDLDGVIYNSDAPIAGAAEAVALVQARRIPHLFLTNTSSRPRRAIAEKLARFGITVEERQILTPAVAAARWLQSHDARAAALFAPKTAHSDFAGLPLLPTDAETGADAVVIGDLGASWDFATINRAFRLLHANPQAHLVALGGTKFWQGPTGLQLDVAPFTAALECAAGRSAVVFGKPAPAFYQSAVDALGVKPERVLMIGDDIEVDIAGAQRAGLQAALVQTGKFRPEQLNGSIRPDYLLTSVAELPKLGMA